jgi:serine/threonine protein kinase
MKWVPVLVWFVDPMYIIMEYVPGGNMQQYLRKFRPSQQATNTEELIPPTAKDLNSYALQVAKGMEHLSSLNVRFDRVTERTFSYF